MELDLIIKLCCGGGDDGKHMNMIPMVSWRDSHLRQVPRGSFSVLFLSQQDAVAVLQPLLDVLLRL